MECMVHFLVSHSSDHCHTRLPVRSSLTNRYHGSRSIKIARLNEHSGRPRCCSSHKASPMASANDDEVLRLDHNIVKKS